MNNHRTLSLWRNRHLWYLTLLVLAAAMFVRLDFILEFTELSGTGWDTSSVPHVLHWLLHFPPILYAAYIFGVRGVVTVTVIMILLCIPDSLFLSPDLDHFFADVSFITLSGAAGAFIAFLRNQREQIRKAYTIAMESREALQESEEKHRGLVNNIKLGIFRTTTGPSGRFLAVNPAMAEISSYSEAELLQMNVADLYVHPEERGRILEEVDSATEKTTRELDLRKKDGAEIIVSSTMVAVRDSNGQVLYFDGILEDISERKRMEEALRQSEENSKAYLESAPDGVYLCDLKGTFLYGNKKAEEIIGYRRDEIVGENFLELNLLPEEYLVKAGELLELNALGKPAGPDEFELIRKDGNRIWTEITTTPIEQEGRTVVIGFVRDITERKRAEEQFENIFSLSPDMVGVFTTEGGLIRINPSWEAILGYQTEELLEMGWAVLIHPDDVERTNKEVEEQLKGSATVDYINRYKCKDGSYKTLEWRATFAKGGIVYATARDITERKEAEETLRESQEKYRAVFDGARDGIVLIDGQTGTIVECNREFERQTGRSIEQMGEMKIWDLRPPEKIEAARQKFFEVRKEGAGGSAEFEFQRPDGQIVPIEFVSTSITTGGKTYVQSIARDITGRQRAEEKEKQLQQELNLSSRLASVGEMASGIAHEINNPLTGVIGFSQLLLSKDIPDDIRDDLQVINSEAQRVAKIVAGLLTFARQRQPGREYLDITDILSGVLELRAYEMKVNNIKVETHFTPNLPKTMADAGQLQQVFLNIILNAEKEMIAAHNRGKLSVTTETLDDIIRVSITDDGPGISRENMDKIFDPFFTTSEVGNGTGLGLSICHGIIAQHNGKIYARSKLGKGASFIIELPMVADTEKMEPAAIPEEDPWQQNGARILVVDDEKTILDFLERLLTEEGYQVETLNRAQAALKRLQSQQYDLILLDIKIPGMSGIDLYYRIEAIDPALTQRVIVITGDVMETTTKDFLDKTGVSHIAKPLNIEQLKKEINQILVSESALHPA